MKPYAVMFRNQQDHKMHDVAIVDPEVILNSRIILNKVEFDVAKAYVEDYNETSDQSEVV